MDNTLKLWDLTTGTELKTLTGHTAYINAIAITGDGNRAISADLESGEAIASFSLILLHRYVGWSNNRSQRRIRSRIFPTTTRDRATNISFLHNHRQGVI
ncbi:hypothetical protein QUA20_02825 [Microcoleus sp. Pol7_A1]|uniref:hypothetical protein n=1 Tax=Microcoleus sp. Pol7_A1 TaxID=2818893 RepID=UPI002FD0917A